MKIEYCIVLFQNISKWSQYNFAYFITVVLSLHVQKFIKSMKPIAMKYFNKHGLTDHE